MNTVLDVLENIMFGLFSFALMLSPFLLAVAGIDWITRKDHSAPPRGLPKRIQNMIQPVRRLLGTLNRRVGVSLPLVIVWYVWLLQPEVVALCTPHHTPGHSHEGMPEFNAMVICALLILLVVPTSIYDLCRRQWFAALAIPLALGLFFVWYEGFLLLIDTGRIVLEY